MNVEAFFIDECEMLLFMNVEVLKVARSCGTITVPGGQSKDGGCESTRLPIQVESHKTRPRAWPDWRRGGLLRLANNPGATWLEGRRAGPPARATARYSVVTRRREGGGGGWKGDRGQPVQQGSWRHQSASAGRRAGPPA